MAATRRAESERSDAEYQERQWRYQRIGWVVIAALLVAALAGLFGRGPLSRGHTESRSLRLEYPRITRMEAPATFEFELMDSGSGRDLALWLDQSFLEAFEITRTVPAARLEIAGPLGATFRFPPGAAPGARRITVLAESRKAGSIAARAAAGGAPPVTFRAFVLP